MRVGRALRGLLAPVVLDVDAVHAPVALAPGRAPIHVVARGVGVLRIEAAGAVVRRLVVGALDEVFFVAVARAAPAPVVRFRGRVVALPLVAVAAPVDAADVVHVRVPTPPQLRASCPDLRPGIPSFAIPLPPSSPPEEPA
jgi:hypothetical protein